MSTPIRRPRPPLLFPQHPHSNRAPRPPPLLAGAHRSATVSASFRSPPTSLRPSVSSSMFPAPWRFPEASPFLYLCSEAAATRSSPAPSAATPVPRRYSTSPSTPTPPSSSPRRAASLRHLPRAQAPPELHPRQPRAAAPPPRHCRRNLGEHLFSLFISRKSLSITSHVVAQWLFHDSCTQRSRVQVLPRAHPFFDLIPLTDMRTPRVSLSCVRAREPHA